MATKLPFCIKFRRYSSRYWPNLTEYIWMSIITFKDLVGQYKKWLINCQKIPAIIANGYIDRSRLTVSEAMMTSQWGNIVTPIPTAGPFTKAISGFLISINWSMKSLQKPQTEHLKKSKKFAWYERASRYNHIEWQCERYCWYCSRMFGLSDFTLLTEGIRNLIYDMLYT